MGGHRAAGAAGGQLGGYAVHGHDTGDEPDQRLVRRQQQRLLVRLRDGKGAVRGERAYGYGKTTLGSTRIEINTITSGSTIISAPQWMQSTRGMKTITIHGEKMYVSGAHPEGHSLNPKVDGVFTRGSAGAGSQMRWVPRGFKAPEGKPVSYATIVFTFT